MSQIIPKCQWQIRWTCQPKGVSADFFFFFNGQGNLLVSNQKSSPHRGKTKLIPWGHFPLLSIGKPGPGDPAKEDAACLTWPWGNGRAERRLFQMGPPDKAAKPHLGILPIKSLIFGQALNPSMNPSHCVEQFPHLQVTVKPVCLCRAPWFVHMQE